MEFDGPAIVCCYTTCQPEHGVADNMAGEQARLAVDTRAFPLLIYDPRKGDTIKERLSLQGNPAMKDDWYINPKTERGGRFHRLRPQRRPLRQALRQGRQPVRDAAAWPSRTGWRTGTCCRNWRGCGSQPVSTILTTPKLAILVASRSFLAISGLWPFCTFTTSKQYALYRSRECFIKCCLFHPVRIALVAMAISLVWNARVVGDFCSSVSEPLVLVPILFDRTIDQSGLVIG